ncbi:MAG: hypothetical protein ACTSSE_09850 [Candidatus Thorarchaeota archaeon]
MTEHDSEKTITLLDSPDAAIVCPFTQPKGKKIGDTLLALMFIVVPLSLLIYFLSILA